MSISMQNLSSTIVAVFGVCRLLCCLKRSSIFNVFQTIRTCINWFEHHHTIAQPCDMTIRCYPSANTRFNLCNDQSGTMFSDTTTHTCSYSRCAWHACYVFIENLYSRWQTQGMKLKQICEIFYHPETHLYLWGQQEMSQTIMYSMDGCKMCDVVYLSLNAVLTGCHVYV